MFSDFLLKIEFSRLLAKIIRFQDESARVVETTNKSAKALDKYQERIKNRLFSDEEYRKAVGLPDRESSHISIWENYEFSEYKETEQRFHWGLAQNLAKAIEIDKTRIQLVQEYVGFLQANKDKSFFWKVL